MVAYITECIYGRAEGRWEAASAASGAAARAAGIRRDRWMADAFASRHSDTARRTAMTLPIRINPYLLEVLPRVTLEKRVLQFSYSKP